MKYNFRSINEHFESAFEPAIPKGFSTAHNIKQLVFNGLLTFVLASTFSSADKNEARKAHRFIHVGVRHNKAQP